MKDYQKQLDLFAFSETKVITEKYFEQYWLKKDELLELQIIKDIIFNKNSKNFPDLMFNKEYKILALKGGLIFTKEDFNALKTCMIEAGDKYFIILEDYDENKPPHKSGPPLRFKYPKKIDWSEINISDGICYELFQRPVRNYFVFGDSGLWGKYVANDYIHPLDIIGFKDKVAEIFIEQFKVSESEQKEIFEWLPKNYKALIK